MKKIIIIFSFLLMISQLVSAQVKEGEGAKIVTVSQASEKIETTIGGNNATIHFQVGVIFERSKNKIVRDSYNTIFMFPWNIEYRYPTFSNESSAFDVSKGFFGDKILIEWEIKSNYDEINLIKIYRRKYTGDNDNWNFISNVSKDDNKYEDLYVDGGVLYEYKVEADGLDGNEYLKKYIIGIGHRSPTAIVTGNVSFEGGSGVKDVTMSATTNSNNEKLGRSVAISGQSFLSLKNLNKPINTAATLQTWVKPFNPYLPNSFFGNVPINLFKLSDSNKEINIDIKLEANENYLVLGISDNTFMIHDFFPSGEVNNRGDDILVPVSDFNTNFTHVSVILEHNLKYRIFINGREINDAYKKYVNEIEVTASNDVTKKTKPYESFSITELITDSNIINLGSTHENFWDNIEIGGNIKAIFDEIRIWNDTLSKTTIRTDFKRYLSGNDSRLISYLGVNEGLGNYLYDYSRDGFNYNKNHAEFVRGANQWSDISWLEGTNNSPSTSKINSDGSGVYQLGVLGVTDQFGNYEISAIPYSGNGESFKITPSFGLHKFEPNQKLVYLGKEASVVNEINFIDKSSFQFKGQVLYDTRGVFSPFDEDITSSSFTEDGYNAYQDADGVPYAMGQHWKDETDTGLLNEYAVIGLKGAYIYIDDQIVIGNNNLPIETDSDGKFTISVPIGNHSIKVKKLGHTFLYNGRYPEASEDEDNNYIEFFEDKEGFVTFIDTTRVTIVGRVVGGAVQADKVIGFSGFLSNNENEEEDLNNKIYTNGEGAFFYIDTDGKKIQVPGVFKQSFTNKNNIEVDEIISSLNNIGQAQITLHYPNHETSGDVRQFTFKTNKESGEYRIQLLPLDYKYKSDDLSIPSRLGKTPLPIGSEDAENLSFSKVPTSIITPEYESENILKIKGKPYHFTKSFNYRAVPVLNVISQESDDIVKIGDANFSTEGFTYPIYSQNETYKIELETFEKYTNYDDTTQGVEDIVPVIDGTLIPTNNLALNGIGNHSTSPNSNLSTYTFKAGIPSFITTDNNNFTKTISLKYRVNGADYEPKGNFKDRGIVIGGKSDGSRTFTTSAPDIPDFILRDPPGSNSFASIESGQSISLNTNAAFNDTDGGSENLVIELGTVFKIGGGLAGPSVETEFVNSINGNISAAFSASSGEGITKTYTFNQTISTSDAPDWVGADADLYIGNSVNYFNGTFNKLGFSKVDNGSGVKLNNTAGDEVYLNKTKNFFMSPEPSDTFFVYSQRYILQELIPEFESIIKALNEGTAVEVDGDGEILTVDEYKEQIRLWKEVVLKNELDKYIATNPSLLEKKKKLIQLIPKLLIDNLTEILKNDTKGESNINNKLNESNKIADLIDSYFKENISFDAGVGKITRSVETTTITTTSTTFNITLDESVSLGLGGTVNNRGVVSTTTAFFQQDISNSLSEEDTKTTIFSYTLKDNDPNNLFSVDVINYFGNYGPIFSTQGGKTSCPYEGSELSSFFTKAQFETYFKDYFTTESDIVAKEAEKLRLENKYSDSGPFCGDCGRFQDKEKAVELGNEIIQLKEKRKVDYQNLINNFSLTNDTKAALSYATQKIEDPIISVEINDVVNIPESDNAIFKLTFENNGATEETLNFRLRVDNTTNKNNAIINIEPNGTIVSVPKEGTSFTMTLAKLPSSGINDYKNIKVILESLCDDDLSSSIEVSASFVPTCTGVVVASPVNNWLFNKDASTNIDDSSKPLNIKLNEFNTSYNSFDRIELKFKSSTSPNVENLHTFYKNEGDYDNALNDGATPKLVSLIGSSNELIYPFFIKDRTDITDGDYEIYAVSYCTNGTETSSEVISGRVDLNAPKKFGTPLPIDGIYGVGEDLRVRFNEKIVFRTGVSKIEILGITNQQPIDNSVSLFFNGVSNTALIEKPRIVSGDFSIEFWMKNETPLSSSLKTIFSQQEGLSIGLINGELKAKIGSNIAQGVINDNNLFHHYTISYESESGKLHIYEDDKEIALKTGEENMQFTNNKDLIIGGSDFVGNIRDLRMWSKFIKKEDSNANKYTKYIGNESQLLGYWLMDEGRGTLANDLSFFKHAKVNTNWDIKPKGDSYQFNNSQYLELDELANVILTENMDATISFWVKTGTTQEATIFSNGRGDGSDEKQSGSGFAEKWSINLSNNGLLNFASEGKSYPMTTESITDDQWHHVALVLNRLGSLNTYIDAEQVSSNSVDEIKGFSGTRAWLGARGHRDADNVETIVREFNGKIDEFRLWNSARTIDQISRDRFYEVDNQSLGLMLYLRFNELATSGPRYWYTSTGNENLDDNNSILNTGSPNYNSDVPAIKPARSLEKFDFSLIFNANADEMVIEPKVSDIAVLEGQVLDITVSRMFDSANNKQESTISWTAYVQKNEVNWFVEDHNEVVELIKYKDEEKSFEIILVNNGGTSEPYSILSIPNWLHLDAPSGVIGPDSKRIVTVTIDKELPAGVYEEILHLETDFGHNQKLPLNVRVLEQEPDWTVNPNEFTSSSNIIGKIKVDGIFSDDMYDRIGVFYKDEVRGVANLVYDESYRQYYAYLTVYSGLGAIGNDGNVDNSGEENFEFKIWDASSGKVLQSKMNDNTSLTFLPNDIIGDLLNPALFENTSSIEQNINFNQGWNWVSFNVDDENFKDINTLTDNLTLKTNDRIIAHSPNKVEVFTEGFGWDGSISATNGGLNIDKMYKVFLSNKQSLKVKGTPVNLNSWSFLIKNDWNWLPFSLTSNTLLNDALSSYQASVGDVIKSQNLFAIYDYSNGWIGSLNYLEEGKGYMLQSNVEQVFQYPQIYSKSSIKSKAQPLGAKQAVTASEFLKYSSNMNAIVQLPEEYNELLVFDSSNTLKGISTTKVYGNKKLSFITVYGDGNDELEFYIKNGSGVKSTSKKFNFKKDLILGTYNEPIDLSNIGNLNVSPNPFSTKFSIQFDVDENQTTLVELYSTTGQLVYQKSFKVTKGISSITVEPKISKGVYLLRLVTNKDVVINKVIKN